jgi:hypothetical protein
MGRRLGGGSPEMELQKWGEAAAAAFVRQEQAAHRLKIRLRTQHPLRERVHRSSPKPMRDIRLVVADIFTDKDP